MKFTLLLAVSVLAAGCTSVTPQQESARKELAEKHHYQFADANDFYAAIDKDNLHAVQLFMSTRGGYPFWDASQNSEVLPEAALDKALTHPQILDYLLKHSATPEIAKHKVWERPSNADFYNWIGDKRQCHDETIVVLTKSALAPEQPQLITSMLLSTGCPVALKTFLAKYPEENRNNWGLSGIGIDVKKAAEESSGLDDEQFGKVNAELEILLPVSDRECKKAGAAGACKTFHDLTEWSALANSAHDKWKSQRQANQQAEQQKTQADESSAKASALYESSGQRAYDRACKTLAEIEMDKKNIKDEQAIGESSGVVNKMNLYQAGRRLEGSKMIYAEVTAEYKKRTGRSFDSSKCGKKKSIFYHVDSSGKPVENDN